MNQSIFFLIVPSPTKGILEIVTLQSSLQLVQPVSSCLGTWFDILIRNAPLEGVGPITERARIRGRRIPLAEARHPPFPSPSCEAILDIVVIVAGTTTVAATGAAPFWARGDVDSAFRASLYRTFLRRANFLYDPTCLAFALTGPSTSNKRLLPPVEVVKAIDDVAAPAPCAGALADPDGEPT